MGFWVDSFGWLNLQKTVVSTSGYRGFLVNLHLPFIQFWDKSPLAQSILVVKHSETMIFLGVPHFEKHPMGISLASFGDFNHQMETNQDLRVWEMCSMKRVYSAQQLVCQRGNFGFLIHNS